MLLHVIDGWKVEAQEMLFPERDYPSIDRVA
jgi:hypothetical protein